MPVSDYANYTVILYDHCYVKEPCKIDYGQIWMIAVTFIIGANSSKAPKIGRFMVGMKIANIVRQSQAKGYEDQKAIYQCFSECKKCL